MQPTKIRFSLCLEIKDRVLEFIAFSCGRSSADINRGVGIRKGVEFVRLSLAPLLPQRDLVALLKSRASAIHLSLVLELNKDHTWLP
jgi:hypothetical protein